MSIKGASAALPTDTVTYPAVEDGPDYTNVIATITFNSQGENFECHYYADKLIKVSHAELGSLVEPVATDQISLLAQVELLASALLERRPPPAEILLTRYYEGSLDCEQKNTTPSAPDITLRLGRDYCSFGGYTSGHLSSRNAWAISAGVDRHSPSSWVKGDADFPNEDALLLAEQGERCLLAVADAHFGLQPSHVLLEELAGRIDPLPQSLAELTKIVAQMAKREPMHDDMAGASLLIAVYDRTTRTGFGISFGDCTFALIGARGHRIPLENSKAGFVHLSKPASLRPDRADTFEFSAESDDLLLMYTDGVNECHYREPATSVTPGEMQQLYGDLGCGSPQNYLHALMELALSGVNGNPGGEDNITAIAVRA